MLAAISSALSRKLWRCPAVEAIRVAPHGLVAFGCDRRDDLLDDGPDGTVVIRTPFRSHGLLQREQMGLFRRLTTYA